MSVEMVSGSKDLVRAEFQEFYAAYGDDAADGFRVFSHLATGGMASMTIRHRDGFGFVRPLCHQAAGWGMFFEFEGLSNGPWTVTLLKVADFNRISFDGARQQAIARWNKR